MEEKDYKLFYRIIRIICWIYFFCVFIASSVLLHKVREDDFSYSEFDKFVCAIISFLVFSLVAVIMLIVYKLTDDSNKGNDIGIYIFILLFFFIIFAIGCGGLAKLKKLEYLGKENTKFQVLGKKSQFIDDILEQLDRLMCSVNCPCDITPETENRFLQNSQIRSQMENWEYSVSEFSAKTGVTSVADCSDFNPYYYYTSKKSKKKKINLKNFLKHWKKIEEKYHCRGFNIYQMKIENFLSILPVILIMEFSKMTSLVRRRCS